MDPKVEQLLKLPNKQKIAILVAVVVLEAVALVYFLYLPKHKMLTELKAQHQQLQAEVDENTKIANNLPKIQKEYNDLNLELEKALTELPNSKEIPSLLTSITATGKNAGLDFLVFRPKPEVVKDFYAEVPVDITVSGSYFSVANFFAAVANLPRIVNITNVDFAEVRSVNNRMMTKVNCLATTFRFLGKEEIKNDKNKPKK
ncbi:type IV pilus inner membrane component PilO [Trichlorobacter lovleyi]|uniref:Pilus assembly protein PilO n=1 Tax=Trichlorobacter lovleyi (strain ATCC BAA-1151 / DSM 17278 / SZ) TaxID=398767 RepID=B3E9T2_TRIL1|nr:type 4a pilus biogenesis protein PilO [Trichlorobacter lovleyi]ACD95358.1 Pilus assembly protein PilO [Trichlorobacter lovleyi SZ]